MKVIRRFLSDVLLVDSPRFTDSRGSFVVPYEVDAAHLIGLSDSFVQDNHSISKPQGTVRGLHLQLPPYAQGKLIRVLKGRIFDVVVDLRPGSDTLGQHAAVELDSEQGHQLWVPRGFAHGFCTMEPDTEVFYKVDAAYRPDAECSLAWDDPVVDIGWPVAPDEVVLSGKDEKGMSFAEIIDAIKESRT